LSAIGEFDLELLEDYLDDALSPAQVEHVARRLTQEPELAMTMHELRAGRVLRTVAWRSMEPTDAQTAFVADHVAEAVRKDAWQKKARRSVWISAGVAAGVAFFVIGWMTRTPPSAPSPQLSRQISPGIERIKGPTVATSQEPGLYRVALIDRDGRLMPAQNFSKADDARQFARDLLQYVDRRREAEQGSAMLVSDHF
jgi:hypothetical protein